MKMTKELFVVKRRSFNLCQSLIVFLFLGIYAFCCFPGYGQDKQKIQVKAFNNDLSPYGNIRISINNGDFIPLNEKGEAFIELGSSDLPIKSIDPEDNLLEIASWNLSKGTLEIIVRKKSYRKVPIAVKGKDGNSLKQLEITYTGNKTIKAKTDFEGYIELPLALGEVIKNPAQLHVPGYKSTKLNFDKGEYLLVVEEIQESTAAKDAIAIARLQELADKAYLKNFNISMLDSIQSLTIFYAIFKNYEIDKFDEPIKRKIDAKFESLVGKLSDSTDRFAADMINNISDTTFLEDDIRNLKEQARRERSILTSQKNTFEEKIALVNEKLAKGFDQLNAKQRAEIYDDINELANLLVDNESVFYKNQNSYQEIIASLKDRFFDVQELQGQLSLSEAERLKEKKAFRKQLFQILGIIVLFIVLIILLVYASLKLRRQKRALTKANIDVKEINENLENIVYDRTKILEETFKELDTVLYRASHDLRAPVRSIAGLCNIAYQAALEPSEVIDRMVATNNEMDRLLKKLSVISEIHQPGKFSRISMFDAIKQAQLLFQPLIDANKVIFEVDCAKDLSIFTIPNLIEMMLANLIENAIYYCLVKKDGNYRISIKAYTQNDQLHIVLYDNGIGVESNVKSNLFEMFYRGSEHSKGNGLGLYIVQKSVQVLNGSIQLESEPGKFSRFMIQLPLEGNEEYSFGFLNNRQGQYQL
jgi:signal transduction histidine kinase